MKTSEPEQGGASKAVRPGTLVSELLPAHWPEVAQIYREGIETGNATFETEVPEWANWDASHLAEHRFVALNGGAVVGWVAVSPASDRCSNAGVVEDSVYVARAARGEGAGLLLMRRLVESTEKAGIWTIQTGMFPENEASLALHKRAGFRVVGCRERLGKLNGIWRDVALLERRSKVVGQP
jgi:phosphinothricin acetyltransferase